MVLPPTPLITASSVFEGTATTLLLASVRSTAAVAAGTMGAVGTRSCAISPMPPLRRTIVMPSRTGRMTCSTRGSLATISLKAAIAEPPSFHER